MSHLPCRRPLLVTPSSTHFKAASYIIGCSLGSLLPPVHSFLSYSTYFHSHHPPLDSPIWHSYCHLIFFFITKRVREYARCQFKYYQSICWGATLGRWDLSEDGAGQKVVQRSNSWPSYAYVFYTTCSCVSWQDKTLNYYLMRTKRVSCTRSEMYFA